MTSLGLKGTREYEKAALACRYELWPLELRHPVKPWTLVDVGANTGEFSAAVATLVQLESVHAFEPQPSCHVQLSKILQSIPNSRLHPAAVGANTGEIELFCTANSKLSSVLSPAHSVSNSYKKNDFLLKRNMMVPLVRLDDVIPRGTEIGLMKIDVQGFELSVLAGAERSLRSTSALLMEVNYVKHYEDGAVFDDLYNAVRSHGFHLAGISSPYSGHLGPLWADAMFIKEV